MPIIWLVVILALLIPVLALILDSHVGRALGGRIERGSPPATPPEELRNLVEQLALLESELDALRREVRHLREEQDFTVRLLQRPGTPGLLPPTDE